MSSLPKSSRPKPSRYSIDLTSKLKKKNLATRGFSFHDKHLYEKLAKLERILGFKANIEAIPGRHVISVEDIPLCSCLARNSQYKNFIFDTKPISYSNLINLIEQLTLSISLYDSGSIPAATNPASDYSEHSWTRDTAIIAHALGASKHYQECEKSLIHLAEFYARSEQRDRFIGFHYHDNPVHKYRFGDRNKELPHIRARIDPTGRMVESEQDWSHNQLDAIGMWLLVTFRAANQNILNLTELDHNITQSINPNNAIDSIFSVALKFLNRIQFWEQHDHGPWEDKLEPSRASSLAMGVTAIKEAIAFFNKTNWQVVNIYKPENGPSLEEELKHALIEGEKALCQRIPRNGLYAIETDRYPTDSALSFLLFPFNPGLNARQEKAILRALYNKRMGVVGFTRRDEDDYLGSDYIYNDKSPNFCDHTAKEYKAAEWTLFDPLIAGYYFQRYIESNSLDTQSFILAERHLKRSLAAITHSNDSYKITFDKRSIEIPIGRLPEAYWFDTQENRWRANENTPLLMAEAAFTLMLERGLEATKLYELANKS
jgi:Glycosyl hydrolases family 15